MKKNKNTNDAYILLRDYTAKYVKDNFDKISNKYGITKKDLSDLKAGKHSILEWMLGEYLEDNEFKDMGITIVCDWDVDKYDTHTSIYNIDDKLIRSNFQKGEYMTNHKIEFVKQVQKEVIVYSYEPIV